MDTRHADNRFTTALAEALAGHVQVDVARDLGVSPQLVSDWKAGRRQPAPDDLFRLEAVLGLAPGRLSRHLGYVPVAAEREVADDIAADAGRTIRDYLGDDFDVVLGEVEDFESFSRQVVEDGLRRALLLLVADELAEARGTPLPPELEREVRAAVDRAGAAPTGLFEA